MKKLILTGTALLAFAAAGFAQNNATITQNGTSQTGNASQTGNNLTATVSQVGTTTTNKNNTGESFQSGNGHQSTINQNNGSTFNRAGVTQANLVVGMGSNTATISQSNGSGGTSLRGGDPATAAGDGNWTGVAQQGSGNTASLTQDGPGTTKNFAEVYQYGTNNGVGSTGPVNVNQNGATDGRAQINQGTSSIAVTNNGATVDQSGSTRNDAFVTQLTNDNRATLVQSGSQSNDNIGSVQQIGTTGGNVATISQDQISNLNQAYIDQLGNTSTASVRQNGSVGASNNRAFINQAVGSVSNNAIIEQYSSFDLVERNRATINQAGTSTGSGIAFIQQDYGSDDNQATINQGAGGLNNRGYIDQGASFFGQATINQNQSSTGSDNIASIEQGRDLSITATNMIATVGQEGSRNDARLKQIGSGSQATISQNGNNNVVTGSGTGTELLGGAYALQNGTGHMMTVNQASPGGANTTIFNTATLSQTGTSNMLNVQQTAITAGNNATVTQNGMMNQALVQQNGVSN